MTREECFTLGKITKVQGIKGNVQVFLDTDQIEAYKDLESVFVDYQQILTPFFIEYFQVTGKNKALLKFENINHIDEASELVNCALLLPAAALPKLNGKQFYFHEVIGFTVVDEEAGTIGEINEIFDNPGNELIQILIDGKEVLIPMHDHIIQRVDRDAKVIHVTLPPGYLGVYLDA